MFKFIAVLAASAAVATASYTQSDKDFLFSAFKTQFGKEYATPEEHNLRAAIFAANLEKIAAHNAKDLGWTMSLNEFADLTATEFGIGRIGGFVPRSLRVRSNVADIEGVDAPSSVDWTKKGVVTAVKNQGQCGSCWSFSTTGSTESINAINGNQLVSLSEQQLMDCSGSYGNQGCNGGLMDSAFKYIIANGGLCSEASYPYTARDGVCKTSCQKVVQLKSYTDVPADNADAFKTAVAQQPVSIAIEADQSSFQFYSGGVMSGNCGKNLDHGVLAVGYGTEGGKSFWKVKNSWGASWGMSGYILLDGSASLNGGAGQCGILSSASFPSQ